MKKIGIYLESEGTHGGVYQYTMALLEALLNFDKEEFEVIGICISPNWIKYCKQKSISYYVPKSTLDDFHLLERIVFKRLTKIGRYFAKRRDLLDCQEHGLDICILPRSEEYTYYLPVKTITTIHDLMHRYENKFPEVGERKSYSFREINNKCIVKYADIILTDSELGKKQVEESYLKGKSAKNIIPLPYIAPDYIYGERDIEVNGEWQDIGKMLPEKYFFYPAQFWAHKNHINLLKAINKLKEDISDIHIIFVGSEKNGYKEVENYVAKNDLKNHVTILGYVSNYSMVQLYKRARALIMPSFFGPTNIPQLEAFYLGCPAAVANVYGVCEQVGDAALLFSPTDITEIANILLRLWQDDILVAELIQKGYQKSRMWGQEQFGKRLETIIKKSL